MTAPATLADWLPHAAAHAYAKAHHGATLPDAIRDRLTVGVLVDWLAASHPFPNMVHIPADVGGLAAPWRGYFERLYAGALAVFTADPPRGMLEFRDAFDPATLATVPLADSLAAAHTCWGIAAAHDGDLKHPVAPLVEAWLDKQRPDFRDASAERYAGTYTRFPALADAAHVVAVHVDGDPFATPTADVPLKLARLARSPEAEQLDFDGIPRTLGGQPTADLVLATLADWPLTGDERSRLRTDTHLVLTLGYALRPPCPSVSEYDGARWLADVASPNAAHYKRWHDSTLAARGLHVRHPTTGFWLPLSGIDRASDGRTILAPPRWWRERGADTKGRLGARWRLTNALALRIHGDRDGGLTRTMTGLEAALAYAPATRTGKKGRRGPSRYLVPTRKGGPGPEVEVPWRDVLRLAGEHVTLANAPAAKRRYHRRIDALMKAGYAVPPGGGESLAGGSVEIVRKVRGSVVIRASARLCEAQRLAGLGGTFDLVRLADLGGA